MEFLLRITVTFPPDGDPDDTADGHAERRDEENPAGASHGFPLRAPLTLSPTRSCATRFEAPVSD